MQHEWKNFQLHTAARKSMAVKNVLPFYLLVFLLLFPGILQKNKRGKKESIINIINILNQDCCLTSGWNIFVQTRVRIILLYIYYSIYYIFASKCGLSVQKIKFATYIIPMRYKGNKSKGIKVNQIFWLFLCLYKHPKNCFGWFWFLRSY